MAMMKDRVNLRLRRYLSAKDFRDELKQLRSYRGSFHGDDLFDWFESTGLIAPILRLAWPEDIARRWWREGHEWAGEMRDPVAPDGKLLDAAEDLDRALSRNRAGPLLRQVWPDWAAEQRQKVVMTLRPSLHHSGPGAVSDSELNAFAQFLEDERQDGFFLRLSSFEGHAFDGDDPSPLSGMTSDLQSIAVATEHAVRAMGGTGNQLYMMFKKLWAGTSVEPMLKSNSSLARNAALMKDWPALKAQIAALSDISEAGTVAASLIMAHRIRGAVHVPVPEDDQLELERLFVQIMASAAMTHAHLARETAPTAVLQVQESSSATGSGVA